MSILRASLPVAVAVLTAAAMFPADLRSAAANQTAAATAGDAPAANASEQQCLALAMYWEAKDEGRAGMEAVGWVVRNRVEDAGFPDSICAVVREGGESPPCQFSWWCDGKSDRPSEPENWSVAREVARQLLDAPPADPTGGALFFHSAAIDVPWAVERVRTTRIGDHIYYR